MHPIRYPRNFPTEILHKFSTPRLSLSRHHRAKNHRVPLRSLFEQISNGVYKTRLEQNEEKGKREGRERENKHGRGEREKKRKKKRDNDKKEPVNPFLERDNHRSDRASNLTGHPVAAARLPCLLSPINLLLPLPLPSSLSACRPFDRHASVRGTGHRRTVPAERFTRRNGWNRREKPERS